MRAPLYFRYVGTDPERESEIPIEDLGLSLIGFDRVVKNLSRIVQLNGQVEVKAVAYSNGSLIIDTILELKLDLGQLPFDSIDQFMDFLKLVNESVFKEAATFFSEIQGGLKSLNDYFAKRPFDLAGYTLLIPTLIAWVRNRRNRIPIEDQHLAFRIKKELHALVKRGIFLHALKPIIEDSASLIEVSVDRRFGSRAAKIDTAALGDYLNPEAQILAHLHDGQEYILQGEITSLKATRGESLTFKYLNDGKIYNLDVIPESGKSTKDYVQFYKERVSLKAKVDRNSYFRKPKLHITNILREKTELF